MGELLDKLKWLIRGRRYRIRIHAVRHMIEGGFTEQDLVEAVTGESSLLEDYPEDRRCLIVGYFVVGTAVACPLHVVCDYSREGLVDIVTAYVPQRPWWLTPSSRGRIQ